MAEPIALVRPKSNPELATELRLIADEAERGEVVRCIIVKMHLEQRFATRIIGGGSDLEAAGALAFALHDLMSANQSK